jgi:hypothetical protein
VGQRKTSPGSRGSLTDILRLTKSNLVLLYGDGTLYEDSDKQATWSLKSLSLAAKMLGMKNAEPVLYIQSPIKLDPPPVYTRSAA